ncbi:hypothetical protein RBB77_21510 [Tunturibacter psychrotolerans]|uniref:Uncharacterized protein n=1 Tax=Tunturiibacter psychrotolerans TaxID=3069686 RepID=A0AAU7ZPV0_9BACT
MQSSALYSMTLQSLVGLRNEMVTSDWIDAVNALPNPNDQIRAQATAFKVEHAIQVLSNAALSDIADQMVAQQAAITAATTELKDSLGDLTKLTNILDDVTQVLTVVGQIVSLA